MYGYIDSNGNKHLLSGQQDIPQYTMEQYTALSVKPDIWICTNYDSSSEYGIDSANVKYGNTSVEATLDRLVYFSYTLSANADQTDIPYPTGLNNTNCMMLAFNIEGASGNDIFRMGEGAFSSSFQRVFAILNPDVISVYTSEQLLRGKKVRIVLLKI